MGKQRQTRGGTQKNSRELQFPGWGSLLLWRDRERKGRIATIVRKLFSLTFPGTNMTLEDALALSETEEKKRDRETIDDNVDLAPEILHCRLRKRQAKDKESSSTSSANSASTTSTRGRRNTGRGKKTKKTGRQFTKEGEGEGWGGGGGGSNLDGGGEGEGLPPSLPPPLIVCRRVPMLKGFTTTRGALACSLCMCLCVCVSVCPSIHLSLSVSLSISLSIFLYLSLSLPLSLSLSLR